MFLTRTRAPASHARPEVISTSSETPATNKRQCTDLRSSYVDIYGDLSIDDLEEVTSTAVYSRPLVKPSPETRCGPKMITVRREQTRSARGYHLAVDLLRLFRSFWHPPSLPAPPELFTPRHTSETMADLNDVIGPFVSHFWIRSGAHMDLMSCSHCRSWARWVPGSAQQSCQH